jgi:aminomethyltransferase
MTKPNYAASHQTVRISAKRFDQSPYFHRYATEDMLLGVYARRFYPLSLGEDATERYWALRRGVVMFDVPERPVEVRGGDAVALLENVFARKIASLGIGRARYAIACTPQGGVMMDGVLIRLDTDRFWYVQADGDIETWLLGHAGGLDVVISDPQSWVLQVQGPKSFEVMQAATGGLLDESLGYFHAATFDLGGQNLLVSRTGWTGELGFEVYTNGTATDCDALWDHLMEAGASHGMVFSALESMAIRRLEAGILDYGTDMDRTMTPFEAGLEPFVDLDKPSFVGRDALVDADRTPLLFGLRCATAVPFAGSAVRDRDTRVGVMTAGAWSPFLDSGVGYVRFERPGNWLGRQMTLVARDGTDHRCEIVALPFYDAEKRIPRGLDRELP